MNKSAPQSNDYTPRHERRIDNGRENKTKMGHSPTDIKETRPSDGRIQTYIVRELQKEMAHLTDSFGVQAVIVVAFNRIHESNMTKACTDNTEAEAMARKLWESLLFV